VKNASDEFYRVMEEKFTAWAESCRDIRAAFIVGSRVRIDHPADEWSDMDILISSTDSAKHLNDLNWLQAFGPVWSTFLSYTAGGDPERLVIFEGGYQVDFVFPAYERFKQVIEENIVPDIFYRGVRIIIDKDHNCSRILPKSFEPRSTGSLNENMFQETVQKFWFTSIYAVKQLLRGDLWIYKTKEADTKWLLLQMIEWHTKALHGEQYDVWHAGRFLKEWADPRTYQELYGTFGHFTEMESWQALFAAMDLFRRLAVEVAKTQGYRYPIQTDENITNWILAHRPQT